VKHERNDDGDATPQPALGPLERPVRLTEQAYDRIREELLAGGRLARASRLAEREVARALSMSRTPVRDALRRLAAEGLIEPATGGGYARRRLTERDVRECYELCLLLEPVAAALAARRTDAAAAPPRESHDASALRDDEGFHAWVAEQAGNRVLAQVLRAVRTRLLIAELPAIADDADSAHEPIAAAIGRGDADAAERQMADHVRSDLDRWRGLPRKT
jgi:DNA-binding GntR family transcriptional regulator